MRIALISANREWLPDPVVPLGVMYVRAHLAPDHETELWDLCFENDPFAALRAWIARFQPQLVGIGMRNLRSSDYGEAGTTQHLRYYEQLVAEVRRLTDAPILLGGSGFSCMPKTLMRQLRADYGIEGEGELATAALVEQLTSPAPDLAQVPALHTFRNGVLTSNPRAPQPLHLDGLRQPHRLWVDPRHYRGTGIDSVQTKRGCAMSCEYCSYPLIEGRTVRQRDPKAVVAEMQQAARDCPDINHFFVVDAVFNLPPRHAKAICQELIAQCWNIGWTAYVNPLGFTRELAEHMVAAKCVGVEIGSDSGCDEVLRRLRKGFGTEQIRNTRRVCAAAGLRDCHSFILATAGETLADVEHTLRFASELDPFAAIFTIWNEDREEALANADGPEFAPRAEVHALLRDWAVRHPRWSVPPLRIKFDERLFRLLRRQGYAGPLWQYLGEA